MARPLVQSQAVDGGNFEAKVTPSLRPQHGAGLLLRVYLLAQAKTRRALQFVSRVTARASHRRDAACRLPRGRVRISLGAVKKLSQDAVQRRAVCRRQTVGEQRGHKVEV